MIDTNQNTGTPEDQVGGKPLVMLSSVASLSNSFGGIDSIVIWGTTILDHPPHNNWIHDLDVQLLGLNET